MSVGRSTDLASAIAQAMGTEEAETELQTLPHHLPKAPEAGWSDLEKAKLRLGDRYQLTWQEALSLEGEDEADWRDQAEGILDARDRNRLEKALEGKLPQTQRGGDDTGEESPTRPTEPLRSGGSSGSYGIGNNDALAKDLESRLGIRRGVGRPRT